MGESNEKSEVLSDEERRMWERLDAELEPLFEGGAISQAERRLTATLETMGRQEATEGLRARILVRRAECWLDLDDGEAALADARRAMELGYRRAESLALAGWASYHLDKAARALEYFDAALEREAESLTALTGRALALLDLDEYERARADLSSALRQDRDSAELLALRGEAQLHLGELDEAARDLRAAVDEAPEEAEYMLTLARLYLAKGQIDQALEVIDGAVDEAGELALEATLLRSHLHLLAGRGGPARSDAIRASNLFPDEAFAFVQLAHVQLAEGKLGLAQKAAQRAVLLDPSLPDAYLVRGATRQMSGDSEEARKDFERASRAPAELPIFLLGPAYELVGDSTMGFDESILKTLAAGGGQGFDPQAFAQALGAGGPGAGAPGMDPMKMLDRIFDDSGNIRGPLKPFFEMAFKNAPKIMENIPPGLLQGVDREELEQFDFSEMSSDEIEERMREFYRLMKSGNGPFSPDGNDGSDESD